MTTTKMYKPFPANPCERLRRLVALRQQCETNRKAMFTARDHAFNERARTSDGEKSKRERLESDYGKAVMEIERLKNTIKWCNDEIDSTVTNADDGKLFDSADLDVPDFTKPKDEDEEDEGDGSDLPTSAAEVKTVGRPGKVKPDMADPAMGAGIDEHLKASVNELDCREDLKGKLVAAGLLTIGDVAAMIDAKTDLREKVDCGEKIASEIKKAVEAYRKKHCRAIVDNEIGDVVGRVAGGGRVGR